MRKCILLKNIFIIAIISIVLIACGKQNQDNNKVEVKPFEALTDIKEGNPNVYLIVKVLDNSYWKVIIENVKEAAEEQGLNVYFSGSNLETEWESQVELLNSAVQNNADAIIIAPDDSSKLAGPIQEVYEKGIPVVLIDTTITLESYDICYMTDNLLAGQKAAEEMIRQLIEMGCSEDEELCVGVQLGSGSSQTISERLVGFTQYWYNNASPNWTIIDDIKINNGDIELATVLTYDLLDKNQNIKGLFACNNGSTVGVAKAIMESGRDDVAVVGFDYSDEIKQLIIDEKYHASTMIQRQDEMGRFSVETIKKILNGEAKENEVKFFDTGVMTINSDNINSKEVQEVVNK